MAKKEITNIGKLDNKIDKLAVLVKEGFEQVDKRFEQVDRRLEIVDKKLGALEFKFDDLKKDFRRLQSAVDGYATQANTYFMEMAAMGNKLSRHEKWIEKIAEKVGVKLDY